MSIYKAPCKVLHVLESIRREFFHGHDGESSKSVWVKWNSILTAKEKGGLGVASLFALNRALMLKWVWRFFVQRESLWARVIRAIHGEDGNIRSQIKHGRSSCWRVIINECSKLKDQGVDFSNFVRSRWVMAVILGSGKIGGAMLAF
jgi:hypothetical protein